MVLLFAMMMIVISVGSRTTTLRLLLLIQSNGVEMMVAGVICIVIARCRRCSGSECISHSTERACTVGIRGRNDGAPFAKQTNHITVVLEIHPSSGRERRARKVVVVAMAMFHPIIVRGS